ncbi:MAG: DUF4230 domain-containing protein [Ruminiclostridium sp.]|nr:DUF4230 domain-containing protein [Ruminiclostridium sp.]
MDKVWKTIKSTIAVLIVLAIVFGAGFFAGNIYSEKSKSGETITSGDDGFDFRLPGETEKRVVTEESVKVVLKDTSQFSTYSGEYESVREVESTRHVLDDIPVLGTKNQIRIECTGIVKVGYDVENIKVEVDNDSLKIYIKLPEPKILDNYIIWESVQCQEKNNILNPIEFEQYQTMIDEIEADGLAQVEEKGIYADAEKNMKTIIQSFLSKFEGYEIIFM